MADFDFLEGFDMDGDWGFTSVKEKPSEEQSKQTETVVKLIMVLKRYYLKLQKHILIVHLQKDMVEKQ